MTTLTVEEIIDLHEKIIKRTGGSLGIRDQGLLESAVFSADSTFGDFEVYPTIEEKAARLMFSLTSNHAFVDGNKRIGVSAMLLTLKFNEISLSHTQQELSDLSLSVASGNAGYQEILDYINSHK